MRQNGLHGLRPLLWGPLGVDTQGNVYGARVRRQMLERHVKK
jgi:hypothetical protein